MLESRVLIGCLLPDISKHNYSDKNINNISGTIFLQPCVQVMGHFGSSKAHLISAHLLGEAARRRHGKKEDVCVKADTGVNNS